MGETRTVPAGQYATEVLNNLGILAQVKSKLVLSNNIRAVLTAVETGNVDAGFVYFTDAKGPDNVRMVATVGNKLHSPIHYPIAVLKFSKIPTESRQYIQFLQSEPAKQILKKYGFKIDWR